MKIESIETKGELALKPIKESFMQLTEPLEIVINTDEGNFRWNLPTGYVTDGRSGGNIVDFFVPRWGKEILSLAYICHDAGFAGANEITEFCHYPSFTLTNDIFEAMLDHAGISGWKVWIMIRIVSSKFFGKSSFTDRNEYQDKQNAKFIKSGELLFTFL